MKYPGIPPAGAGPAGSGWDLAGSNLVLAAFGLRQLQGLVARVQLAEALRRAFRVNEALRELRSCEADDSAQPLIWFAEGNVCWTVGDTAGARPLFQQALRVWETAGNREGVLAATLGLARCARVSYQRGARGILDTAIEAAAGIEDVHHLADLDRERAAWALLAGEHDEALSRADRAAMVHRDAGDRYLAALADVLRARALNAVQDRGAAIELIQEQVHVAEQIGSDDLEMVALVYLGQFLQRGVTPDTPQWVAAEETLTRGLDKATDPFTRAEFLLPLAHLHTGSGEFDLAQEQLDEYGRIYAALGGNQISTANLLKARARLELARNGGTFFRGLSHTPSMVRALLSVRSGLRRAATAYRKAGLEPGQRSIQWHISLIDVLASGRARGVPEAPRIGDQLDHARYRLLAGEIFRSEGRLREAGSEYAAAETHAVAAGSTMMAVAAASGIAEVAHGLSEHPRALAALRSAIGHAEKIRAAILGGSARGNIASIMRGHYERAVLLAARMGDGDLVLELIERLRTERLAGMLRRTGANLPADLDRLLARLDEVNEALVQLEPGIRVVRAAPAVQALTGAGVEELLEHRRELHAQLARRTTELFADTYGAEPLEPDRLSAVQDDVLAILPVNVDGEDAIISVWRSDRGETAVLVTGFDGPLAELRDLLMDQHGDGWIERIGLTWRDLRPLRRLIPSELLARLAESPEPTRLVIVPTAWLWAVPFAAVPLDSDGTALLVDHADIVLAPSLRFYAVMQTRGAPATTCSQAAVSWVDPDSGITAAELGQLRHHSGGHVELDASQLVRKEFVRGGQRWRTAVLVAHGNREPGLAQAAIAGRRSILAAADFLDGASNPPSYLSLASCHSGYPDGEDPHEPLGLALAALAAGASQVVSAHFEIDGRPGPMTECLGRLYTAMARTDDIPEALCQILRDPQIRDRRLPEPLYRWAALTVVGTHPTRQPAGSRIMG